MQLEVRKRGPARLRNVVTLEIPPGVIEEVEVRFERDSAGRICLNPEPRAIEKCLVSVSAESVVAIHRETGQQFKLDRN